MEADRISARDAQRIASTYKRNTGSVYRSIASHAYRAIRTAVSARPHECHLTYVVPEYLAGLPLYDRARAAEWVAGELGSSGYDVRADDYVLHITWGRAAPPAASTARDSTGRRVMFFG